MINLGVTKAFFSDENRDDDRPVESSGTGPGAVSMSTVERQGRFTDFDHENIEHRLCSEKYKVLCFLNVCGSDSV